MQDKKVPIYLVSLTQDIQRREALKQRFPKNYPHFIHIEAVDGRQLTAKEYYNQTLDYFIKSNRTMSPAELGCTLSHIRVLEGFIKTDSQYALILEDDIEGSDDDIQKIFSLTQALMSNSLVLCGGQLDIKGKKYRFGKKTNIKELYEVYPLSYPYIYGTCCYVVTKKSANKILEYHKNSLTIADGWNDFFKDTDIKIYYANLLSHPLDLSNSHIEQYRVQAQSHKKTLWKKFVSPNFLITMAKLKIIPIIASLMGYKKIED
jgi:glycosyl transferase family 25